ncbi:hypothetical protein M378DRAFT_167575 [Amanita muscaria Koide BX008]|uniref:DUF6534 domain-containing protein n=1 Tax=Amanita muscaria (strain Koide BX008) TaxID=946122 RepID=A0A0C2WHD5_AMAMK|nr:hypothetical protein M378DRAFT_167575 [Amanita muscaria Koide BX008]
MSVLPGNVSLSEFMNNTYGALLIGTLVATFVSGMNALQTILYCRLYPEDTVTLKALVAAVMGLDIAHTGLLWADLWFFFVENFGNPAQVNVIQKPLVVPGAILVGMVIAFIVHMFYLRRVFDLSHRNYWISVPILVLILGYTASVFVLIAKVYKYQLLSDFSASGDAWLLSIGFSCSAAADIAIMACLFVLLRASRKRSISLNNAIDQLILYTLEMGSLTAFMAIAIMITWFVQRNQISLVFLALYLSLAKAYTCAFLGSLNTRYQLRHSQTTQGSSGRNIARPENAAYQYQSTERTDISSTPSQILAPKRRQPSPDTRPHDIHVDVTRRIWNDDV